MPQAGISLAYNLHINAHALHYQLPLVHNVKPIGEWLPHPSLVHVQIYEPVDGPEILDELTRKLMIKIKNLPNLV